MLTGSRTAVVALVLLALWGLADRRLSRPSRALLWASPAAYAVAWGAMALWSHVSQTAFGAAQRLAETDFSAFRLGIWSDTWQLIRHHPLAGVGFGEFNFAWTLSEFPQRPKAFFDHAHNLLLHWAVELGVPLAVLLTSLLLFTLGRLVRAGWSRQAPPAATLMPRATLAFLVLMGLHSQLEYPLWYAYFLLPTAWLMGFGAAQAACCGDAAVLERAPEDRRESQRAALGPANAEPGRLRAARGALLAAALALVLGASASVQDYQRVAEIFDPNSPVPLERRLAEGQRSLFFGHHADYAIATTVAIPTAPPAGPPAAAAGQMLPSTPSQQVLESAGRAAHYLLDTRLMIAWADAWAAAGDQERARHIAARMRELGNPAWADYFSACDRAAPAAADRPYPCEASGAAALDWRDFR